MAVLPLSWALMRRQPAWRVFALVASYVFYAWWDWRFVFLLAASTLCTLAGARLIARAAGDSARTRWLALTVAAELGLLVWFKYAHLASSSLDDVLHRLGVHGAPVPIVRAAL